MEQLPVFLNIRNQPCLIVGGGAIAVRKASLLREAGARIVVVAPRICPAMEELLQQYPSCDYVPRNYHKDDLNNVYLVIAATDHSAVNEQVSADARANRLPVNVVDSPALCSFTVPAIIDRSPIVIAVSSGGQSPVLARLIREKIERLIPAAYGKLAALVGSVRDQVKEKFTAVNERRKFWEGILTGPVAELVYSGKIAKARIRLQQAIDGESDPGIASGEVYLVGAGPGDPELLTTRAIRLMQQADVVLYDRLVSADVLNLVRRDADRIYVGKARNRHSLPQEEINQTLVDLASKGHRVCRLKGGDPFIFGRGGEEIDKLAESGIDFQVVPGVTAASGCAAYAGIPLTHRDYSQSVQFITGHMKDGRLDLDWQHMVQANQTLVFYMGLLGLETICRQLIRHGLAADTPVALIERGTTVDHRQVIGTLQSMTAVVEGNDVRAPTLIIIGQVVKLHEKLKWYVGAKESAPLNAGDFTDCGQA